MNERGVTLLEMMVAMMVIVVLFSIAVPGYRLLQRKAHAVKCVAHLQEMGRGLNIYLEEHHMRMPAMKAARDSKYEDVPTLDQVLAGYVQDPMVFECPADRKHLHEETGTSYFWNSLLNDQNAFDLKFLTTDEEIAIPVISDKENFHHGIGDEVNILYADGHVEKEVKFSVDY